MPHPTATSVLSVRELMATLPGDLGPVDVLRGLSLQVAAGEIVDITGPSGSGKSTLLRALARLLPGAKGELHLQGVSAGQVDPRRWRAQVALVQQKPVIVAGTVRDNLLLPWTLKTRSEQVAPGDDVLRSRLESVGLQAVALDREASRLSVGQQARVALLRVVLTKPAVLLLDEPDAALDEASAAEVGRVTADFAAGGGAVVRVRHQRTDGLAGRRLTLESGSLREVHR